MGVYDSSGVYGLLGKRGIEVVVKPKVNARADRGHPARRRVVEQVRRLGYDGRAEAVGHGCRWAAETVYSSFKGLFGEHSMARGVESIVKELAGNVSLYNMLVNM
jgi:hypothetical protein